MVDAAGQCPIASVKVQEFLSLGFKVYKSERGVEKNMEIERRLLARILPKSQRERMAGNP
jgi:hypothetical protein